MVRRLFMDMILPVSSWRLQRVQIPKSRMEANMFDIEGLSLVQPNGGMAMTTMLRLECGDIVQTGSGFRYAHYDEEPKAYVQDEGKAIW